jgi:HJR/Mrr/RecB family endonuclease
MGKTQVKAKEYIRDVERVKMQEASKAVSLMEAAKIITYTSEKYPKICVALNQDTYTSGEIPPF